MASARGTRRGDAHWIAVAGVGSMEEKTPWRILYLPASPILLSSLRHA